MNIRKNTQISDRDENSLEPLKIILVAENVSKRMGGESGKNIYYIELLRQHNIDTLVVCHARVREELRQEFTDDQDWQKFYFIEDHWLQILIYRISQQFYPRIKKLVFEQFSYWITQIQARKLVKNIIKSQKIHLIFQPSPITPKGLNFMYDLGIPVVIGPLSGGIDFPPAFQYMDSKLASFAVTVGRRLSEALHLLIPGKLKAEALIVANQRTQEALPQRCTGKIYQVIESGVDLKVWKPKQVLITTPDQPIRFVYLGRFVDWKGINLLIEAFAQVATQTNSVLELVGDGELQETLKAQVVNLKLQKYINFHGWMKREDASQFLHKCDVFVIPSVREAGGNAILEAMALGLPIIATNWAGPSDIVDSSCGILVNPSSKEAFVKGLAEAMIQLVKFPELRHQMGTAGMKRVQQHYFDWNSKVERIIEIFRETLLASNVNF